MGTIKDDVRDQHLSRFPDEEDLLRPFLDGFSVTWGRRRVAYNTEVSAYLLKPEPMITEVFGFAEEILLVYAPYDTIQPRTIQAAEAILNDDPAKGRVEKLTFMVIAEFSGIRDWLQEYTLSHQESRVIVGFAADELRGSKGNSWHVRNTLSQQMFERDLFDYRLPLEKDLYFFGRNDIVASYFSAIKRSENRGLFGLRKTGKTSLLFKLERMLNAEKSCHFIYYDCKLPSIRKLHWNSLIQRICEDISERTNQKIQGSFTEIQAADTLANLISRVGSPIVVVFDEIEFISPFAKDDLHWQREFVDFWQTFWACQSRHRVLSTVVAGVNPTVVEVDMVSGIQNPLFGIVPYQYLTGLSAEDCGRMIRVLGRRMGLRFEPDAIGYLHGRYGGHPLLTRIACSVINSEVRASKESRPVTITRGRLRQDEDARDSDLMFYCRHVVSELQQFYPDEYSMLELLASGQTSDFVEYARYPEFTKHLESYGLLSFDEHKLPKVSIPAIERHVGVHLAQREGRRTVYRVVAPNERTQWLTKRLVAIVHDLRFLEKVIQGAKGYLLFGVNSFPEADGFTGSRLCQDEDDFDAFINACNRSFVESIENYGRSIGKSDYFWRDIKASYPSLWFALHRIKVYRVNHMHLALTDQANADLLYYIKRDLEGRIPSQVPDLYFVLQQCVLDSLLTGIQAEASRLT